MCFNGLYFKLTPLYINLNFQFLKCSFSKQVFSYLKEFHRLFFKIFHFELFKLPRFVDFFSKFSTFLHFRDFRHFETSTLSRLFKILKTFSTFSRLIFQSFRHFRDVIFLHFQTFFQHFRDFFRLFRLRRFAEAERRRGEWKEVLALKRERAGQFFLKFLTHSFLIAKQLFPGFFTFFQAILEFSRPEHDCNAKFTSCST